MESLISETILAIQQCAIQKQDVDVYKIDGNYYHALSVNTNSSTFEKRISYENGNIIVRDNKGKIIDRVETIAEKKPAKKKPTDTKSI